MEIFIGQSDLVLLISGIFIFMNIVQVVQRLRVKTFDRNLVVFTILLLLNTIIFIVSLLFRNFSPI